VPDEHLSTTLFRETRGTGFFRVLAGKNSPFYVDVLDGLERESSDRADEIAREEAIRPFTSCQNRTDILDFSGFGRAPAEYGI
jgi:hypothetical protein